MHPRVLQSQLGFVLPAASRAPAPHATDPTDLGCWQDCHLQLPWLLAGRDRRTQSVPTTPRRASGWVLWHSTVEKGTGASQP